MRWKVTERFNREGTCVHPWLIHADVWQKPTQRCKALSLQLKQSVHESYGDFAEMQILTQQVQKEPRVLPFQPPPRGH